MQGTTASLSRPDGGRGDYTLCDTLFFLSRRRGQVVGKAEIGEEREAVVACMQSVPECPRVSKSVPAFHALLLERKTLSLGKHDQHNQHNQHNQHDQGRARHGLGRHGLAPCRFGPVWDWPRAEAGLASG